MALRKFSTTFLMSTSAADSRQIPATGASVEVYRQGAKVTSTVPVLTSATLVNVRSVGAVVVGDTLQSGTDTTRRFTVTAVTSTTALTMTANGAATITLATNTRLVVVSAPLPILYDNDASAGTPLTNPATADSQGYIEFYTPDSPFDMIVRRSGMNPEVYEDLESGEPIVASAAQQNFYTVTDYPDVATALAEVPAGARLYFPISGGPYTPPTAAGWLIEKSVEIFSDGNADPNLDSIFKFFNYGAHKDSVIFTVAAGVYHVYLHDFIIYGPGLSATDGTGDAIRILNTSTMGALTIERVWIYNPGRSGVRATGPSPVNMVRIVDVSVYGARGIAVWMYYMNSMVVENLWCTNGYLGGFYLESSGTNTIINLNCGSNLVGSSSTTTEADAVLKACAATVLLGCNFEGFSDYTCKNALLMTNCHGCVVGGSEMDNANAVPATRGIYIRDGSYANTILSNNFSNVATTVEVDSAAADFGNTIMPQSVYAPNASCPGAVVQPANSRNFVYVTDRTHADGLANNKGVGMLFPSLTASAGGISTADAGSTVAAAAFEGTLVYNSNDNKLYVLTAANTWTAQT